MAAQTPPDTTSSIVQQPSAPRSSHQNGSAENANHLIGEKVQKLLNHAGIPIQFWPHAFMHAVFMHNQLPLNGSSPNQRFNRDAKVFDASNAIPFGARVFVRNEDDHQKYGKQDSVKAA
ncbi:unnamed protein product [Ambrosiozyma monospora]|uniref:Unnamed protein product n=1 Tax=Ambrosiozyma monospora TaxID=43982 RepID=A0A9W6T6L9_AMBMO|nr:unnamed protein product [Ambrosiozyma monospora]